MDAPMAQDFISEMEAKIRSLYEGSFPQNPEDSKSHCCDYCRFIDFCRRTPSKPLF
jgi:CRISPR/Cas system-associated exonuclease Cas4 (RecB family)